MIGLNLKQGDLYVALLSSIVALFSTMNREECVKQQIAFHAAQLEKFQAELATIQRDKGDQCDNIESESSRSAKRCRI
jgi:hypothetical protein